jgi:hypothetical protein
MQWWWDSWDYWDSWDDWDGKIPHSEFRIRTFKAAPHRVVNISGKLPNTQR